MQISPAVLEKKIFEGFLPYMGMTAILVMWPGPHMQTFFPPSKSDFNRPSGSRGEDVWKCEHKTHRQTTALPYDKLTNEPSARA